MWLREIEADRLRNLRSASLELSGGLTLIAGRNGQGKTSLLEAIYLLGTGRSFRTRQASELIHWEGGPAMVRGRVENRLGETRLAVRIDEVGRALLANGGETDLESFIGRLDVVDLTAERMKVLRGGPDERRRFIDRGVAGLRPSYLRSLGEYRRVLLQRNALLRGGSVSHRKAGAVQLDVWDGRLAEAGAELNARRREYVTALVPELEAAVAAMFPSTGGLELTYRPSPAESREGDPARFGERFATALEQSREQDLSLGHTTRGPHRDDLKVQLGGVDLRKFGSAGQVRAAMVALKLGKLALLAKDRGEAPVFLMDDFDSHLDETRAATLARFLRDGGFQALVATSKEEMARGFGVEFDKVLMKNGVVG